MAVTFSWLRLAAKASVVLVAALVLEELAKEAEKEAEKEAKAVGALALAQAAACSPDRAVKAAQVKEPKAVR